MKHFSRSLLIALLSAGLSAASAGAPAAETERPVVVELFTSQGCSSCPPAEAYLAELADRDDVIALEYHVDYWDYIGWKDPFAQPRFTERQRTYVGRLGARYVYTPKMVIDGAAHEVGSRRERIERKIARHRDAPRDGAPRIEVDRLADGRVEFRVVGSRSDSAYDVYMVIFDRSHTTEVQSGENAGMTLINRNVVRSLEKLGEWRGGAFVRTVPLDELEGDAGCAVLVQAAGGGEIAAARRLDP